MNIVVSEDALRLGQAAGSRAAEAIRNAIDRTGQAEIILATGSSQFETLHALIKENIDWSKVILFHLDEYIGLPATSPAGFGRYLKERFIEKVTPLKEVHLIDGGEDPVAECQRLSRLINERYIDVALVGIGENGHLAFNDPPADFETESPFIIVDLDEKCRRQQTGEGWFKTVEDVPRRAISMSVKQIMKSAGIICSVPDSRKAMAVRDCFELPVSNLFPASILQCHANCFCYLDKSSSALLKTATIKDSF
jgi:glucosamine-6-phosphate deaminase